MSLTSSLESQFRFFVITLLYYCRYLLKFSTISRKNHAILLFTIFTMIPKNLTYLSSIPMYPCLNQEKPQPQIAPPLPGPCHTNLFFISSNLLPRNLFRYRKVSRDQYNECTYDNFLETSYQIVSTIHWIYPSEHFLLPKLPLHSKWWPHRISQCTYTRITTKSLTPPRQTPIQPSV